MTRQSIHLQETTKTLQDNGLHMGNMEAYIEPKAHISAIGVDAIARLGLRQSKALAAQYAQNEHKSLHKMKNRALNKWSSLNVNV